MIKLHLPLDKNSLVFKWALVQTDRIGARGHVGTHLDCYAKNVESDQYLLNARIIDCENTMPTVEDINSLGSLFNQAIILRTLNVSKNRYGTKLYFATKTRLTKEVLMCLLEKKPSFILIDSHGIGANAKEHIVLDKLCEDNGVYIIENLNFGNIGNKGEIKLKIEIEKDYKSSGKPCYVYVMD